MITIEKAMSILLVLVGLSTSVFARNEGSMKNSGDTILYKYKPHDNVIGLNVGVGGMSTGGILKKKAGSAIYTADVGITYNHYFTKWIAINTGFIIHVEWYVKTNEALPNDAKLIDYMKTPLCFSVPMGIHFNIPKCEWIYMGAGLSVNIPIANLKSLKDANYADAGKVFLGVPINFGIDMMKASKSRGSRILLRITPTFHKARIFVPLGFTWQYNWKVKPPKIEPVVVPVPVIIVK